MNSGLMVLTVLAAIIVLGLAAVAGYYLMQLRQLRQRQQQQRQLLEEEGRAQRKRVNRSIQIIAQGLLDEQLTLTEGAIRIKVLLDGLAVDEQVQAEYTAFYQLAAATDHIPILEAWKALDRKQQRRFDLEREKLEVTHRDFVLDAARRIRGQHF